MEYRWEVSIDVDNDVGTGHGGGFEYLLSATHIVFPAGRGGQRGSPDRRRGHSKRLEAGPKQHWEFSGRAELEVSAEEDTITLSGLIPGITADSRLAFRTDDFLGGLSDEIDCQASASLFLVPGPCGSDEAMVRPNQTIADTPEEELPAYIDFVGSARPLPGKRWP